MSLCPSFVFEDIFCCLNIINFNYSGGGGPPNFYYFPISQETLGNFICHDLLFSENVCGVELNVSHAGSLTVLAAQTCADKHLQLGIDVMPLKDRSFFSFIYNCIVTY